MSSARETPHFLSAAEALGTALVTVTARDCTWGGTWPQRNRFPRPGKAIDLTYGSRTNWSRMPQGQRCAKRAKQHGSTTRLRARCKGMRNAPAGNGEPSTENFSATRTPCGKPGTPILLHYRCRFFVYSFSSRYLSASPKKDGKPYRNAIRRF